MTLSSVGSGILVFVIIIVMVFGTLAFFRIIMGLLAGGGKGKSSNAEGIGKGVGAALHGVGRGVGAAGEGVGKGAGALAGGLGKGTGAILKPLIPSASGLVTVGGALAGGVAKVGKGVGRGAVKGAGAVKNAAKRKIVARNARKRAEKELNDSVGETLKEADELVNQATKQAKKSKKEAANPFAATAIRWRFDSKEDAKRAGKILLNDGVAFGYQEGKDGLYLLLPQAETVKASEAFSNAGAKSVQAGEPCEWLGDKEIVVEIKNDDGTPYLLPDEQEEADAQALEAEAEKVRKMKEEIDRQEAAKIAKEKRSNQSDWQ